MADFVMAGPSAPDAEGAPAGTAAGIPDCADARPESLLVRAGQRLDARHVALLAAQGVARVTVARRPRLAVVTTGTGAPAAPDGQARAAVIHGSNRSMLVSLALGAGLEVADIGCRAANLRRLGETLRAAAYGSDLVITSGVATGEEEQEASALALAGGIGEGFRIVKSGRPALVGRIGRAIYLGLPGNPVSALVAWSFLGRSIIAALEGRSFARPLGVPLPLEAPLTRQAGRTAFAPAKAVVTGGELKLRLVPGKASRLGPLVEADGLLEIPAQVASAPAGTRMAFHAFDRLLGA